jgi:hypothetical protein
MTSAALTAEQARLVEEQRARVPVAMGQDGSSEPETTMGAGTEVVGPRCRPTRKKHAYPHVAARSRIRMGRSACTLPLVARVAAIVAIYP